LSTQSRPRVLVLGGGFAGIGAARKLGGADVDVVVVDRHDYHTFQPLLYQFATGLLETTAVGHSLRDLVKDQDNAVIHTAPITEIDLGAKEARFEGLDPIAFDYLVLALGAEVTFFGTEGAAEHAFPMYTLPHALRLKNHVLERWEAADKDPSLIEDGALNAVVVGGGPTGVEMAGQIGELALDTLRRDFRNVDPRSARILLVEAADRVLTTFPPSLSAKAERSLRGLGVTVLTGRTVVGIDDGGVMLADGDGTTERVASRVVIWAAGVTASSLAGRLGELAGAERDRAGRVTVEPDLTLPGRAEVYAIGDMVRVRDATGQARLLPGVAPVAMQQGRHVASVIRARLADRPHQPFRYRDKGNLATIGRAAAVADIHGLKLSGFLAWMTWLLVHLWYLIGFQNRVLVLIRWSVSFLTHGRGARLIGSGSEPR
jgi:NADH dehydrogenase